MASKVLLTGASGYIAQHITSELLSHGFKVIGTVRRQEQADQLHKQFSDDVPALQKDPSLLTYVLVPDMGAPDAFDEVLKSTPDITYVLHTACPVGPNDDRALEDVFFKPVVEGTKNIFNAIRNLANDSVKNVVLTSSFVTLMNADKAEDKSFIYTEKSWNNNTWDQIKNRDELLAYTVSKTEAEKGAWDFVDREKPNFKLTTVHPPLVFGPQKFDVAAKKESLNFSAEIVGSLLRTKYPSDDKLFDDVVTLSVDVRDVALYHVLPLLNADLASKRLAVVQGKFSAQRILNIINENFPELKGKIAVGKPEETARLEALKAPEYNNSVTVGLTGVDPIPLEKTVVDSVKQILRARK
ncbi:Aldehyde reductase [Komagataella phaffii CBS 7435]|uniref:Dihydrokaempferol 4-reductase n=2 Tax=Komagataella phaffii TaxID=460519 RepID=C4R4K9_KOMPG|nr:Putative dihydrokaempferol 4-reductase [Komagataella phaffii GS115]AOA63389.1 GQ67_03517T0 [Komagataella phaffii]CAH2449744.1 Putative aldehyde reductase [Komagataella phaffii CBS 7435]AOA68895.1 GQ68_03487T0 [Komagataella phaffii GS115]CAY70495.1 Putative dihydrokaempferol 4-reductase [Komagataella phaffii GS115]CCA39717.1 Aldehyde reductase [Komagataella phaffii CBS 7435]